MSKKTSFKNNNPQGEWRINLTDVLVDDTFRCREQEDGETVEAYAEVFKEYNKKPTKEEETRLRCGGRVENSVYPFPPVVVWQEDEKYYLIAGFHRYYSCTLIVFSPFSLLMGAIFISFTSFTSINSVIVLSFLLLNFSA